MERKKEEEIVISLPLSVLILSSWVAEGQVTDFYSAPLGQGTELCPLLCSSSWLCWLAGCAGVVLHSQGTWTSKWDQLSCSITLSLPKDVAPSHSRGELPREWCLRWVLLLCKGNGSHAVHQLHISSVFCHSMQSCRLQVSAKIPGRDVTPTNKCSSN